MVNYPTEWTERQPGFEWREVEDFVLCATFESFCRGRSSALATWKAQVEPGTWFMFLTDLADAMPYIKEGKLLGTFRGQKRGTNYGIKFVPPVNPKSKGVS